jgi:hypothetical protein
VLLKLKFLLWIKNYYLYFQNLPQLVSINYDLVGKSTKEAADASKPSVPWHFKFGCFGVCKLPQPTQFFICYLLKFLKILHSFFTWSPSFSVLWSENFRKRLSLDRCRAWISSLLGTRHAHFTDMELPNKVILQHRESGIWLLQPTGHGHFVIITYFCIYIDPTTLWKKFFLVHFFHELSTIWKFWKDAWGYPIHIPNTRMLLISCNYYDVVVDSTRPEEKEGFSWNLFTCIPN